MTVGPTSPAVNEEQAIKAAHTFAEDLGMSELNVRDVQLRVSWLNTGFIGDGIVIQRELRLFWWVQLDNVWNGTPGLTNFRVDAMTGEVTDPF